MNLESNFELNYTKSLYNLYYMINKSLNLPVLGKPPAKTKCFILTVTPWNESRTIGKK